MSTSETVLHIYVEDCVRSEESLGNKLRGFVRHGGDGELNGLLNCYSDRCSAHVQSFGEAAATSGSGWTNRVVAALADLPDLLRKGGSGEQQDLANLLSSYAQACGHAALYESLGAIAHAQGNDSIENLSRSAGREHAAFAEQIWHLISSRSKVAFNLLTASEVDPSVETRRPDDRLSVDP